MDRGEGQQWNRAPGNLYSAPPNESRSEPGGGDPIRLSLDR